MGKRTTWLVLGLTAALSVTFVLTGHENIASGFTGLFIIAGYHILGVKQ